MLIKSAADRFSIGYFPLEESGGVILTFHAIRSCDRGLFRSGLEYLAEQYLVVPLDELIRHRAGHRHSSKPELALTFDDGLRNQFVCAYPLLKWLEIPATFFVCANLIETGQWLWTKEVRARLGCLPREQRKALTARFGCGSGGVEIAMRCLKMLPLPERLQAQETIRGATPNFRPRPEQREEFDPMSWEELTSIDPCLINIGSHTMNHPVLTSLGGEELEREIGDSRVLLEEKLCRPIRHFCYPEGRHDRRVQDCVRRYYATAVSTVPGRISADTDVYSLPRVPAIFGPDPLRLFEAFRATA